MAFEDGPFGSFTKSTQVQNKNKNLKKMANFQMSNPKIEFMKLGSHTIKHIKVQTPVYNQNKNTQNQNLMGNRNNASAVKDGHMLLSCR